MYTSDDCTATAAIANLCNSPPDNTPTSRSMTCFNSASVVAQSRTSHPSNSDRSSFRLRISPTIPRTARGIWSTYCGLIVALRVSSKTLVK
mmetsp:Transcript_5975/g.8870  ORF Transcript_5975/g.8870 Transcript_5975/m.8870 type:complete len:91 (+) Transcript_5975:1288-1560(+)